MLSDIALNRPALQSSTGPAPSNKDDPATEASRANNGDTGTLRTFHTKRERDPWWQVDLGDSFLLDRVVIHNRDTLKDRLARFTLLRSNDGVEWFPFYRKSDRSTFDKHIAEAGESCLARFVRVRLDGVDFLHFRKCEVWGKPAPEKVRQTLLDADAQVSKTRNFLPDERHGHISQIDDYFVFVDDQYALNVSTTIGNGNYESRERKLTKDFIRPGDKVLEVGTAIGIVSMTMASLVGAANVHTFDANPDIIIDAQANFRRNGLSGIVSHCGILRNRASFKPGQEVDFYIHEVFVASRLNAPANSAGFIKTVKVPVYCLEDEIERLGANVLVCDIEGGEVDLLQRADLSGIRLIVMETHYPFAGEVQTDEMIGKVVGDGFSIHLEASGGGVVVLRRHG